jgi:hypothetical protein
MKKIIETVLFSALFLFLSLAPAIAGPPTSMDAKPSLPASIELPRKADAAVEASEGRIPTSVINPPGNAQKGAAKFSADAKPLSKEEILRFMGIDP